MDFPPIDSVVYEEKLIYFISIYVLTVHENIVQKFCFQSDETTSYASIKWQ